LIQEDYDAAKLGLEMGKSLLPHSTIWLVMISLIHARFYRGSNQFTNHCFMDYFFGEMVLVEGDISQCKRQPVI
jgi:hypothetical protein